LRFHQAWMCFHDSSQKLSTFHAGVKNLLAGEQQAAVTVAVEALMDAKPEADAFATFDPKARFTLTYFRSKNLPAVRSVNGTRIALLL